MRREGIWIGVLLVSACADGQDQADSAGELSECPQDFLDQYDSASLSDRYAGVIDEAEGFGLQLAEPTDTEGLSPVCMDYKSDFEINVVRYQYLEAELAAAKEAEAQARDAVFASYEGVKQVYRAPGLRFVTYEASCLENFSDLAGSQEAQQEQEVFPYIEPGYVSYISSKLTVTTSGVWSRASMSLGLSNDGSHFYYRGRICDQIEGIDTSGFAEYEDRIVSVTLGYPI